jgi:two-component system OmpR family response regulator
MGQVGMRNGKQALVADDNPQTCLILKQLLEKESCRTQTTSTLKTTFSALEEQNFDYLFLDLHLPDGMGTEVIGKVREKYPNMRVIIISAWDGSKERLEAATLGADHFIAKPFTSSSIKLALES